YYTHSNNLFLQAKEIGDRFYLQQRESESKKPIIGFLARRKFKVEHFDGFVAKNNRIYPKSSKVFQEDPDRLIRIFQHAQVRHLRLAPELSVLIKRNWKLINRSFRYNDANRDTFEAILSRKGDVSTALREMHSSGILGRYLPEFGALTNLVQHEFFHRYSADEHTLRVTEELDKLILESEDQRKSLYREIYQEIEDPFVLYLAVILHDTGRAMNTSQHEDASATLAQNVARRFSLKTKRRQLLLFLVNSHLELWRTANTKNINDPSTIVKFAQIVGSKRWLNYLMLLTYADSRGTDLRSWTDTKEAPLRFLFLETREYLEDAKAFSKKRKEAKDELLQRVIEQLPQSHKSTAMDHFVEMPARYFLRNEASHIARHVKLLVDYFKDWASTESVQRPILHWREIAQQGCSEFSVIWQDQHKLASCLTGALAAQKVNIISAEFFARGDGVVLDIFRVCSTKFEPITSSNKKKNIEKLLVSGLTEKDFSYDDLIKEADKDLLDWHELANQFPQRVYINNQAD
nr:HD domain-containing protein [Dehalococcoidia bacterium]